MARTPPRRTRGPSTAVFAVGSRVALRSFLCSELLVPIGFDPQLKCVNVVIDITEGQGVLPGMEFSMNGRSTGLREDQNSF